MTNKKQVTIELIDGEAGRCIGINEYRVCGPKPIHGVVVQSWKTTIDDVLRAFLTPDQKHEWLARELTIVPVEPQPAEPETGSGAESGAGRHEKASEAEQGPKNVPEPPGTTRNG